MEIKSIILFIAFFLINNTAVAQTPTPTPYGFDPRFPCFTCPTPTIRPTINPGFFPSLPTPTVAPATPGGLDSCNLGISMLGMQSNRYSWEVVERSFRNVSTIRFGFLYNTFGTSFENIRRLLANPNTVVVRGHLINETCQRPPRTCFSYEILSGISEGAYESQVMAENAGLKANLIAYAKSFTAKFEPILPTRVACYLSFGLESNLSANAMKKVISWLKPYVPSRCKIVWNPVSGGSLSQARTIGADVFEKHGYSASSTTAPCIQDLDGEIVNYNATNANGLASEYSQCVMSQIWTFEQNGLEPEESFKDPRTRVHFPSLSQAENLNRIVVNTCKKGVVSDDYKNVGTPRVCRRVLNPKDGASGFVYKLSDGGACNGFPTVVLPNSSYCPTSSVHVYYGEEKLGELRGYGQLEPPDTRCNWKCSIPLKRMKPYFTVYDPRTGTCWGTIADPNGRTD